MSAEQRTCQCGVKGCREPIGPGGNGRRKYAPGHRQRHHRKKVEEAMKAAGLPAAPSLRAARTPGTIQERNGDAQRAGKRAQTRKPRQSGTRMSWSRGVTALAARLQAQGYDAEDAEATAATWLRPALSDRDRARLDART